MTRRPQTTMRYSERVRDSATNTSGLGAAHSLR